MHKTSLDIIAIISGFTITLFLSMFFTRNAIAILPKLGFVDDPSRDSRRIHKKITPTSGGIAIFFAFLLGFLIVFQFIFPLHLEEEIPYYLIYPILFVVLFGLLDDRFEFKAKTKLILQILVGVLCFALDFRIEFILGIIIPSYLSFILTIIWVLACINGFNLIDGIDGLAAGLGGIASFTMGIFLFLINSHASSMIMFLLCASCLGFLKYNFKNALIFMGDAGSGFIGITFAIVSMYESGKLSTISFLFVPLLALGLPFFDTVLAIFRRVIGRGIISLNGKATSGENIFKADNQHIHHRVMKMLHGQIQSTILLYAISILICIFAIGLALVQSRYQFLIIVVLLVVMVIMIRVFSLSEVRNFLYYLKCLAKKKGFLKFFLATDLISDIILIALAVFISKFLFLSVASQSLFESCIAALLYLLMFFTFSHLKRICWFKYTISQLYYIFKAILTVFIIMMIFDFYLFKEFEDLTVIGSKYYIVLARFIAEESSSFLMALFFIIGKKLLLGNIFRTNYAITSSDSEVKRILVYSSGRSLDCCRAFCSFSDDSNTYIAGIIDEDPCLKGKIVFGHNVLGELSDLDNILKASGAKSIYIVEELVSKEVLSYLKEFCTGKKIELMNVSIKENKII